MSVNVTPLDESRIEGSAAHYRLVRGKPTAVLTAVASIAHPQSRTGDAAAGGPSPPRSTPTARPPSARPDATAPLLGRLQSGSDKRSSNPLRRTPRL